MRLMLEGKDVYGTIIYTSLKYNSIAFAFALITALIIHHHLRVIIINLILCGGVYLRERKNGPTVRTKCIPFTIEPSTAQGHGVF